VTGRCISIDCPPGQEYYAGGKVWRKIYALSVQAFPVRAPGRVPAKGDLP